jgi:hypothetical protein
MRMIAKEGVIETICILCVTSPRDCVSSRSEILPGIGHQSLSRVSLILKQLSLSRRVYHSLFESFLSYISDSHICLLFEYVVVIIDFDKDSEAPNRCRQQIPRSPVYNIRKTAP